MKRVMFFIVFLVSFLQAATEISVNKNSYNSNEDIVVTLKDMANTPDNWVGIYEKGKSNNWDNVVAWSWADGIENGELTIKKGVATTETKEYEARVFFNNTYNVEAKSSIFKVIGQGLNTTVTLEKDTFQPDENIKVHLTDMLGDEDDWIAIYPKNKNNDWKNVVVWDWTNGIKEGDIILPAVAPGEYEVRVFFKNSFITETKASFEVIDPNAPKPPTIYENAEDGNNGRWIAKGGYSVEIKNEGYNSNKSVYARAKWKKENGVWTNLAYYQLTNLAHTNWNNTTQKFLEFEHKTTGSPCFTFGVQVKTLQGDRIMSWSMWYEIQNMPPTKIVYDGGVVELVYPYDKKMRYKGDWKTHRFDLEAELKKLEPNNRILSINYFYTTGGKYFDNIRLVSK
jgi:hypothetical protein